MSGEIEANEAIRNLPNQGIPVALSDDQKIKMGICPVCENKLAFQEGCKLCYACGWGGCST